MFISLNGWDFFLAWSRALSCNASQDICKHKGCFMATLAKSWQAMVPCLEAQEEIQLSGPIHEGLRTSRWEKDVAERKKLKRSNTVKFHFLFSVTDNVFLQILKVKTSYNPFPQYLWPAWYLPFGDVLFTVQLFFTAMASGRFETEDVK